MSLPTEFVFLRPLWLVLLVLGPVVAYVVTRRGTDSWTAVCDPLLLKHLITGGKKSSLVLIRLMILSVWTLAVLALAGPAWDQEKTDVFENLDATVIVLDMSESMNSTDLLPSRFERARYKAIEIIENHNNRAIGLVVFAGSSFDVVPVSDDVATLTHLIQSLQTSMMPLQGSLASLGIERAQQLLEGSGYTTGYVVLITDGADSEAMDAAEKLQESGYTMSVVAVGTEAGAPVIDANGNFLRDSSGQPVTAALDYSELSQLAVAGGGTFSTINEDVSIVSAQVSQFALDESHGNGDLTTTRWKDRGPYVLILLLPLAALLYRRGWLLAVAMFFVFSPQQSMAFDWADLWKRSDQRAAQAISEERFDDQVLSQHSEWNGIAHYRKSEFEKAAVEFSESGDPISLYNQGNAFAKAGNLPTAVERYEAALDIVPDFEDAQFNLDIIKELLEQQNQSMDSQQSDEQDQSDDQQVESKDTMEEDLSAMQNRGDGQENQDEGEVSQRSGQQAMGGQEQEDNEEISEQNEPNEQMALQADLDEEIDQVMEQWLRKIPDDPAGLLRRKFHYEYMLRDEVRPIEQRW